MKYQLADEVNGVFGDIFNTIEDAEAALQEAIKEGQALNDEHADEYAEAGKEVPQAQDFFCIVAHGYRVEFEYNPLIPGWREAQAAASKFEMKQAGAGEVSGSRSDCESYKDAFDQWVSEYQGAAKEALEVVIVKEQTEL